MKDLEMQLPSSHEKVIVTRRQDPSKLESRFMDARRRRHSDRLAAGIRKPYHYPHVGWAGHPHHIAGVTGYYMSFSPYEGVAVKNLMLIGSMLAMLAGSARGDDWPQWMGTNRDDVWSETGIIQ